MNTKSTEEQKATYLTWGWLIASQGLFQCRSFQRPLLSSLGSRPESAVLSPVFKDLSFVFNFYYFFSLPFTLSPGQHWPTEAFSTPLPLLDQVHLFCNSYCYFLPPHFLFILPGLYGSSSQFLFPECWGHTLGWVTLLPPTAVFHALDSCHMPGSAWYAGWTRMKETEPCLWRARRLAGA